MFPPKVRGQDALFRTDGYISHESIQTYIYHLGHTMVITEISVHSLPLELHMRVLSQVLILR
jgi:hypothetical protein